MRIHAGRIARRRLRHRAGIYYYRRNRRNRRSNRRATITFGMIVWAIIAVVFIVALVSTI